MKNKVKTYPRLAKLIAETSYNPITKVDLQTKINVMNLRLSVYAKQRRAIVTDWEGPNAFFGRVIKTSFKFRHQRKATNEQRHYSM